MLPIPTTVPRSAYTVTCISMSQYTRLQTHTNTHSLTHSLTHTPSLTLSHTNTNTNTHKGFYKNKLHAVMHTCLHSLFFSLSRPPLENDLSLPHSLLSLDTACLSLSATLAPSHIHMCVEYHSRRNRRLYQRVWRTLLLSMEDHASRKTLL